MYSNLQLSEIGAYDFETWEWVNPKCCCIMYGPALMRRFVFHVDETNTNPKAVACNTLLSMSYISKTQGIKAWFAHNGGKFDALFMLEAIETLGWKAKGFIAGGRLISLQVTSDVCDFALYDSYAIVSSSLDKASKSFETKTRKVFQKDEYAIDVRQWERTRLEAGCKADCLIVLELIEKVQEMLTAEGGSLKPTAAACALTVMKARAKIPTLRFGFYAENELSRLAYCGGRVEVFRHKPKDILSAYDINSSYPASMRLRLPWKPNAFHLSTRETLKAFNDDSLGGVFECTVTVPTCDIPPLPHKAERGGLFFPVGKWRAWFIKEELQHAIEHGTRVHFHSAVTFHYARPFEAFVDHFFEIKNKSVGAQREFAKLILNSGYGKLGQKPEKETLQIFNSEADAIAFLQDSNPGTCKPLGENGRYLSVSSFSYPMHSHFAAAATITANSRIALHKFLLASDSPAYCDTDSIHCNAHTLDLECSTLLGGLKKEQERMTAEYYAPKLYALHPEGKPSKFASKGFHVDAETFVRVVAGEDIHREGMQLARSQAKTDNRVRRVNQNRHWKGHSIKRQRINDEVTVPWHINQIRAGEHKPEEADR